MKHTETRPGLENPVDDAQLVFKAALNALSRPGLPVRLSTLPPSPYAENPRGACMTRGMTALALALCDMDTPVWLDPACNTPEVRRHLRFHCGCPLAEEPHAAAFAFIGDAQRMPYLHEFRQGVPEYPDRSTTLVIRAELTTVLEGPFGESEQERYEISGPGVKGNHEGDSLFCTIGGLPEWFRRSWAENSVMYPLGVDVLLVDDSPLYTGGPHVLITGLPRSAVMDPRNAPRVVSKENVTCMSQ